MTILETFFDVVDFWAPQSGKIRDKGKFLLFWNVQLLSLFYILILHEISFPKRGHMTIFEKFFDWVDF